MTDARVAAARQWLATLFRGECQVRPLAGDASFRRYFRVLHDDASYVLMDAPPGKEDVTPFLDVRGWLADAGMYVPQLVAEARGEGFLLLEDFGDVTWASHLAAGGDAAPLFEDALRQLHLLQGAADIALPCFDVPRMQCECDLYLDWYLPRVAGYAPTDEERQSFHRVLLPLLEELAALPRLPVHLDYHSRNLMLPQGGLPLGVIDFQDAVHGPVTYDLASLLYDCYQDYPETERRDWSRLFFEALPAGSATRFGGFEAWHRLLRLTAWQRHIKATGIFARLAWRDGKRQFLDEIPLTRKHLLEEMAVLGLEQGALPLLFMSPRQCPEYS